MGLNNTVRNFWLAGLESLLNCFHHSTYPMSHVIFNLILSTTVYFFHLKCAPKLIQFNIQIEEIYMHFPINSNVLLSMDIQ